MKKSVLLILGLMTAGGLLACGGQGDLGTMDLALTFSPRDLPTGTAFIRVFVMPAVFPKNAGTVACEDLVGPTATKTIYEFENQIIKSETDAIDPTQDNTVTVEGLPVGLMVFYIEALNDKSGVLAYGCGKGQIDKGLKTYIPIRLVSK